MKQNIYYRIINKDKSKINDTDLARSILKEMLEKINIDYDAIEYSKNGKPYFKSRSIYFNYSHSKNYILIAISPVEIGVDIEENRNISDSVSKKYLNNVDKKERLKYWVIKESYIKLIDKPELLYEDIDILNIKYNKYIISNNSYIGSIMYDGKIRELIEL